jgi:hypothetical protein
MPTPITDDQLFIYAKRAKGKVVVITGTSPNLGNPQAANNTSQGAASGIGRETALTFARYG